ncbi:MAG TPA: TRAP transporter small permease subunit, partial [Vicinamibacterales bacterium]|nr:TRAP transporter small permease subunit [Vicinamibacterales bacterium]
MSVTSAGNQTAAEAGASPVIHGPQVRRRFWHLPEDLLGVLCLVAMVVLPLVEIVGRPLLGIGVPGSVGLVQHLTMWVAFVGAMVASRQRRHLALATATFLPTHLRGVADVVAAAATASVGAVLAYTSAQMVYYERLSVQTLTGGIPIWVAGGGEKVTLRIAAQYAQYTNFAGTPDEFEAKSALLKVHCDDLGTDFGAITRSANYNTVIGATEAEV